MKHTFISKILLAATAAMLLFSACQKDTVTLKARFEQFNNGSKLHLSDRTSSWDAGDQIYIDGYWYQINSNGNISDVRASNRYVAYFVTPNTVTDPDDGPARFTIPAEQQYTVDPTTHNQKVIAPMYANSTNTTLAFKNMGAVLAIQLSNTSNFSSLTIDKIEITASNLLLWGTAVIDDTDPDAPTFSCIEGTDTDPAAQRTLTLRFDNNPLTVSTGQTQTPTVYVSVPAVLGNNIDNRFTIKIYTHQGGTRVEYTRSQSVAYSGSIYRNQWANVPFALVSVEGIENVTSSSYLPEGILNYNYVFSVSGSQKVYFSQGNLQYDMGSTKWYFAEDQDDYIGDDNISHITSNSGRIDLFGWGTSGHNTWSGSTNGAYRPYDTYTTNSWYYLGSSSGSANDFAAYPQGDWGSNVIENGKLPNDATATPWRTLTYDEFGYLLGTTRSKRKVDNETGHTGRNYAYDVVNYSGKKGLLIYPDATSDVTVASSNSPQIAVHGTTFDNSANNTVVYTITSIPAGCVFLPASPQRNGTNMLTSDPPRNILCYWTASVKNTAAYAARIVEGSGSNPPPYTVDVEGISRVYGCSVRLVCDVP